MTSQRRKPYRARMWGAFIDGKLYVPSNLIWAGERVRIAAVYPSRRDARIDFEDVRPVEVREIKPRRRKK